MNPSSNLILVGPMGAGKTSIGRRIALHFGLEFVDVDQRIEAQCGVPVREIFDHEGESGFRRREAETLRQLCAGHARVIATGGGAVISPENRALVRHGGFVVWLRTSVDRQLLRLAHDRSRPLLACADRRQRLVELARARDPLYTEVADLVFESDQRRVSGAAALLVAQLAARWERRGPGATSVAQVEVELGARRYPICIGRGLLDDAAALEELVRGRQVLIVTDQNVAPHWLPPVQAALNGKQSAVVVLPPGEQEKTLTRFAELMARLAAMKASRDVTLIALGGGVVGDLTGFAAACWMRGVRFIQLPTTLLAMVDASVGGKTAVDLPGGKNLVGAFHQPVAVWADIDTLSTLPDRELRAGLAEVIKYGAIGDRDFFEWLETHVAALLARDPAALTEAIMRSCAHKAGVVARDENEHGERALLNFGHTFGHALETAGGYANLVHGEAVAIGMHLAARLSSDLARAPVADADRLEALLEAAGLATRPPHGANATQLMGLMKLDKKAVSGRLRLILWRGIGDAEMVEGVDEAAIVACINGSLHV